MDKVVALVAHSSRGHSYLATASSKIVSLFEYPRPLSQRSFGFFFALCPWGSTSTPLSLSVSSLHSSVTGMCLPDDSRFFHVAT